MATFNLTAEPLVERNRIPQVALPDGAADAIKAAIKSNPGGFNTMPSELSKSHRSGVQVAVGKAYKVTGRLNGGLTIKRIG